MVQHERDADQRHARGERALECGRHLPALRRGGLEQRPRARGADRLGAGRGDQCGGAAVHDGLGCGDHDHRVGVDERAVDPKRDVPRGTQVDELRVFHVVHDHAAAEAPPEFRRCEQRHVRRPRASPEAAGDQERLLPARHACALELGRSALDRGVAWIGRRAGDRQARQLDDDRHARRSTNELLERRALERIAERLANGGCDVGDDLTRRRWPQHDHVVRHVQHGDTGPGEKGDTRHGRRRYSGRGGGRE